MATAIRASASPMTIAMERIFGVVTCASSPASSCPSAQRLLPLRRRKRAKRGAVGCCDELGVSPRVVPQLGPVCSHEENDAHQSHCDDCRDDAQLEPPEQEQETRCDASTQGCRGNHRCGDGAGETRDLACDALTRRRPVNPQAKERDRSQGNDQSYSNYTRCSCSNRGLHALSAGWLTEDASRVVIRPTTSAALVP
jgi:hypothetical protein